MTFWLILALLVPVAALVAFAGDAVAKRVGKRHWRLFGLRPRATATLVAVVTGVLIALSAFGAFLLLAQDARETILSAERIRLERDGLKAEVQRFREEVGRYEQVVQDLKAQTGRTLAERNQLATERKRLEELLEITEQRLQDAGQNLSDTQQELNQLRQTFEQQKASLAVASQEKKRFEAERQALQDKEVYLLQQAARAQSQLNQLGSDQQRQLLQLFAAEQQTRLLESDKRRLEQDIAVLNLQRQRTEEARSSLERERNELQQSLEAVRQDEQSLQERLGGLQAQVARLENSRKALLSGVENLVGKVLLAEQAVMPGGEQEAVAEAIRRADLRVRALGLAGSVVLEKPKFPLVVRQGVILVRPRGLTPEGLMQLGVEYRIRERAFVRGEVLATAMMTLPASPNDTWRGLELLWQTAEVRLVGAGWVPEKLLAFDTEQALDFLNELGRLRGQVRVGLVAFNHLYPTESPKLILRVLP